MVDTMAEGKREARRVHDAQLKASVLGKCAEPGASVAQVAMQHGLNANLVHRWRRIAEGREPGRNVARALEQFVAVPIAAPALVSSHERIRIELRRAGIAVIVEWPVSSAAQCAAWLRELMR
jgi:transposase